jgi:hypothetical protein
MQTCSLISVLVSVIIRGGEETGEVGLTSVLATFWAGAVVVVAVLDVIVAEIAGVEICLSTFSSFCMMRRFSMAFTVRM